MKPACINCFRHGAFKRSVAGLLLLAWLAVLAAVLLPRFHSHCHADAHNPAHECAVTALEQGKFIGQSPVLIFAVVPPSIYVEPARLVSVCLPAMPHRLAPGRAPPTA